MKNFIEQVTNLERETTQYVPKRCFDALYFLYMNDLTYDDSDDSDGSRVRADMIKDDAFRNILEKPNIPDDEVSEKKPVNICPYCGEHMTIDLESPSSDLQTTRYNRYSGGRIVSRYNGLYIRYRCYRCGSISPFITLTPRLVDKYAFEKELESRIQGFIEDREIDEEEKAWEEEKVWEAGDYDDE